MKYFSGFLITALSLSLVSPDSFADVYSNTAVDVEPDAPALYRVQPGDTLWSISEAYYGTPDIWGKISKDNDVSVPVQLQPGQVLNLGALPSSFPGVVTDLTGAAWRIEGGQRQPLREGEQVQAGDLLESSSDGFVAIRFVDGAKISLPSNTRVILDKRDDGRGVSVSLVDGEVESRIPRSKTGVQHFDVVTPSGNLGVRGTHFRAAYHDDDATTIGSVSGTTTSVLEGRLDASLGRGRTDVAAGQGAWYRDGQLGVVKLLPSPRLASSTEGLGDSVELILGDVPGAALYRVQLATDADFYRVVQDISSNSRQLEFSGLDEGLYYLRLTAVDDKGIEGMPGLETLFYRPLSAQVEYRQGEWVFHWNSLPDVSYRLQLSVTQDFSAPLVDKQIHNSKGANVRNLPAGHYYWRVTVSQAGQGASQLVGSGRLNAAVRH